MKSPGATRGQTFRGVRPGQTFVLSGNKKSLSPELGHWAEAGPCQLHAKVSPRWWYVASFRRDIIL